MKTVAVLRSNKQNLKRTSFASRSFFSLVVMGMMCLLLMPVTLLAVEDDDLCASVSTNTKWSKDNPCPLQPPDTSSPRAMLESFMHYTSKGVEAYRRGGDAATILAWFKRAERCLDLSEVSPDRRQNVSNEAGLLLYEILNRVGLPEYASIPGKQEVVNNDIKVWRVPHTDIAIHRVEEGENVGEYLFSPRTVASVLDFYSEVKHLPHNTNYAVGNYEDFVTHSNIYLPRAWADDLPGWAKERVYRNPVWKWLAIVVLLSLGIALAYLVFWLGRSWDKRFVKMGGRWGVGTLVFAISLVIIPNLIEGILNGVVGVRFELNAIISKILLTITFVAVIYALFVFIEFVTRLIISAQHRRGDSVNANFVRVSARMLGIVASIFIVIEATEFLGFKLAPVLAGLGIGGLAVALAARPTLENIIGGFTLFADKPVRVGDFCSFGEQEGTVEEIGLRSTRIRLRDDTLVSVPNADFSQIQLQNQTLRRQRLYRPTIGLRYETTPEQLRYVIARLREMLIGHPKVEKEPLYVRFLNFGDYSLNLEIFANIKTRDWLEYRAIREDINLRIMDIVKEAGTGFAFPSQTNYFASDAGLDTEHGQEAEEKVEFWRARNKLPFPEFEQEEYERLEDILDYPPKGSPDHTPQEGTSDVESDTEAVSKPDSK